MSVRAAPLHEHAADIAELARREALALSLVNGVGPSAFLRRVEEAGTVSRALERFAPDQVSAARQRAGELLGKARAADARCVVPSDEAYPAALAALPVPPPVLWLRGTPALGAQRSVAIVGTRAASASALRFAHELATACARANLCVVSGLARGVDGAAHRGALDAHGATIGVLGTGVDIAYPPSHRALQREIATDGLLLSEIPIGERGHAGTFPQRNRLIAALSEITVVVEAGRESGALITARVAQELGRTVCAVPGSVHAPECAGSNALIQAGAQVLLSPDDLLSELGIASSAAAPPQLEGDAAACWDALQRGVADVATIAVRAGLSVRQAHVALAALELHGLLELDARGQVQPLLAVHDT